MKSLYNRLMLWCCMHSLLKCGYTRDEIDNATALVQNFKQSRIISVISQSQRLKLNRFEDEVVAGRSTSQPLVAPTRIASPYQPMARKMSIASN
jgi:hypothetical protein